MQPPVSNKFYTATSKLLTDIVASMPIKLINYDDFHLFIDFRYCVVLMCNDAIFRLKHNKNNTTKETLTKE